MLYLLARLSESATWAGIAAILTGAFGISLSPALWQNIVSAGIALAGLAAVLIKERAHTTVVTVPVVPPSPAPAPANAPPAASK